MPVAWFFAPYKLVPGDPQTRYCSMNDFSSQIRADVEFIGGEPWAECEMLGDYAVVKVRASSALLTTINAAPGMIRIPARFLDLSQTLGNLTAQERTTILNFLQARGYPLAEIQADLGGSLALWQTKTLRQVLRFALKRRLKPRWDRVAGQIVIDGPIQPTRDIDEAAGRVN